MSRTGSLVLAAALVGWNNLVLPRVRSARARALVNAVAGTGLTAVAAQRFGSDELGLSVRRVPQGIRVGVAASVLPAAGMTLAASIPAVRSRVRTPAPREGLAEWILLQIPVGTVLAEELMFRSVLSAVLRSAWSPTHALALHAGTFGLWHVRPARDSGDNVLATVAFTAASAVLFETLRERADSVVAPALAHLTVNVGGALLTR